jgi:hypothetical protein
MAEENNGREAMLLSVAAGGPTNHVKRLALVVTDSRASYAVAALRDLIETYVVDDLEELRAVLATQFQRQYETDVNPGGGAYAGFVGIDISRMSLADTELFASALQARYQTAVVYVVTSGQLDLFDNGTFDVVVR